MTSSPATVIAVPLLALSACVAPVNLGGATEGESDTPGPRTALPPVQGELTNVVPTVHGDSVGIDFDPVDDAVDYRVYPLPADDAVSVDGSGHVTVRDAIYRCAGSRQTFDLQNDLNAGEPGLVRTRREFSWNATIPDEPTLGHVYVSDEPGRRPVYAVAGKPTNDEGGWRESRAKIYTTDAAERDRLLAEHHRDDGIVFYVPVSASPSTRTVYRSRSLFFGGPNAYQHYFDETRLAERADDEEPPTPAFDVLAAASEATKPLMVVGYDNAGHDELAVGKERFRRAAYQGKGPLFHVEWSGLTEETTLVVEALDSGCPFQGLLAASSIDAPPHQPFFTLGDVRESTGTGEVFVNGQFDVAELPDAVARTFVTVRPSSAQSPEGGWDFHEGFEDDSALETVEDLAATGCFRCVSRRTPKFQIELDRIDQPGDIDVAAYGSVLGQLWLAYSDSEGGNLARAELTALTKGNVNADPSSYLHVTFTTAIAATGRRFPQLIVSDLDAPTQDAFRDPENDSLVLQVRGGPEIGLQLYAVHGLVNGSPWAVDNPEPAIRAHPLGAPVTGTPSPVDPPFEHAGLDRMTTFDVYVSASRYYVFLDGEPAGCSLLPPEVVLSGPVSVTFGDVFFDEAAEPDVCIEPRPYDFQHRHSCHETTRAFDDLGFTSGTTLPAWDEDAVPCQPF